MQALGAMLGGGGSGMSAAGAGAGGEASVLSAWKDYEAGGGDIEAGSARGAETAASVDGLPFLSSSLSSAAEGVSSTFGRMGSKAKEAVTDPAGTVQAAREALPDGSNMAYATMLFGAGAFFLVIAFFIALPVLIVFPAKFALSFTTGCACIIAGITVMKVRSAGAVCLCAGGLYSYAGVLHLARSRMLTSVLSQFAATPSLAHRDGAHSSSTWSPRSVASLLAGTSAAW